MECPRSHEGHEGLLYASIAVCLLLCQIITLPSAKAIGMSPAYREIYFEPNLEETFQFIMIGDRENDLLVRPYVEGDLANYTTIPDQAYLIPAGKGMGLLATLKLPEKVSPGMHMLEVGIMEEVPSGTSGIVAKLGAESLIGIRVPYPAKFLEMTKKCVNVEMGKDAVFEVDVFNRGTKDLQDVRGYVEIFSPEYKKLGRTEMNQGSLYIPSMRSSQFTANWDTTNSQPGYYQAVITINYDGNQTSGKCNFRVGELNINIRSFGANDTEKGGIAKFTALLHSTWNSEIPQVFNTIEIINEDGALAGTSSGETIRVGSWSEKQMVVYWDAGENDVGEYAATLLLEYEGKNSTKSATFRIVAPYEWLFMLLQSNWYIIVIAILVLLIVYQAIKSKRPKKTNVRKRVR